MPEKRITPPDDMDRLKENLMNNHGMRIKDRASFDKAWDEYLGDTKLKARSKKYVWNQIKEDKRITEEKAIKTVEDIQDMAREITKKDRDIIGITKKDRNIIGIIKNKRVFATEQIIIVKGKKRTVLRDDKGRFARRA